MPPTEEFIGTAEAARLLRKSPRTIHRKVEAGELVPAMTAPGGKVGTFLFRRSDIEAIAKSAAA